MDKTFADHDMLLSIYLELRDQINGVPIVTNQPSICFAIDDEDHAPRRAQMLYNSGFLIKRKGGNKLVLLGSSWGVAYLSQEVPADLMLLDVQPGYGEDARWILRDHPRLQGYFYGFQCTVLAIHQGHVMYREGSKFGLYNWGKNQYGLPPRPETSPTRNYPLRPFLPKSFNYGRDGARLAEGLAQHLAKLLRK